LADDVSTEKRVVLALVLSALVLLLWQAFFAPKPVPPTEQPSAPAAATGEAAPATATQQPTPTGQPSPTAEPLPKEPGAVAQPTVTGTEETIVLAGEEVILHLSTRGARITQVELVNYAAAFGDNERLKMFYDPEALGALQVIDTSGRTPLADTVYEVVRSSDTEVVMEAAWSNGLRLRKTFRLDPTRFHVDLDLEVKNESGETLTLTYLLVGSPGLNPETRNFRDLQGKVCLDEKTVKSVGARTLQGKGPRIYPGVGLTWAAGVNQYFALAVVPRQAPLASVVFSPAGNVELVRRLVGLATGAGANPEAAKQLARTTPAQAHVAALLLSQPLELTPGRAVTHEYRLFCGPKQTEVLASYKAEGLPQLVGFSYFSPLSPVILFILGGFFKVTHSYGLAIILMTALIKAALLPLSHKGQTSMHRMQQIQPKIKELQERHKGDKQKLGEEQMKLMREHGVNPFGGCLPMLLQFPVFISLFRALRSSFELRQRSFLWIDDLSQPDAIATLPFSLPLLGNNVNLLPLLWMGSMVLSQSLMPKAKSADPQQKQQQMMAKFFPLMFGVMLYGYPAGLFLYFVTMSFLSIAEQRFIRKRLANLAAPTPSTKPTKPTKQAPSAPQKPSRKQKR